MLDGHVLRAGTLIQCVRRWGNLTAEEQTRAALKLAAPLDGTSLLQGDGIGALAAQPGFRLA